VARKQPFLGAAWSSRWDKSYQKLNHEQQKGVDKRCHRPAEATAYARDAHQTRGAGEVLHEARANDGDRVIHRIEDRKVWFVDIVVHDDIGRYGKALKGLF